VDKRVIVYGDCMVDTLLTEVDAALRADRAAKWWKRNRSRLITAIVLLIGAVAVDSGWQYYRQVQGGKQLLALNEHQQTLAAGKPREAAAGFAAVAAKSSGEAKALALLWQARAEEAAGNKVGAAKALSVAANDTGANLWADMACLRLSGLASDSAKACLNKAGDSPLASTRAQWALAQAWAEGEHDAARKQLDALLNDPALDEASRARLESWRGVMQQAAPEKP
jgi:hypothetical protein